MIHLLLALTFSHLSTAHAPVDTLPKKNKIFSTTIVTTSAQKGKGYFYSIDDSAISLSTLPLPKRGRPLATRDNYRYQYQNVDYVKMQRKGSAGRGTLYGALAGIGAGVIAGFVEGDDKPDPDAWISFTLTAGQKALGYGILFGVTGALVGLAIGALSHKKFIIGGNREKFQSMKTTVLQRVYGTPENK